MRNKILSCTASLSLLAVAILSLAACDGGRIRPVATEPDVVSERVAAAAEKAAKALDEMASIDQVRTPLPPDRSFAEAPSSMTQIITVKWSGPIEQIAKTLATRAGLGFRTSGNPPAVPLTVNIDAYQQSLLQVLRDIGTQAGRRADLSVDNRSGVIEIRYAPNDK
jgi:defect-in-organelle-trafficking protein DotD